MPFLTMRRLAALTALGAAAAFTQLTAGAAVANDLDDCGYEAPVITATTLVLELSTVDVGQGTTAHATVSAGDQTPEGTVTFAVGGTASQVVALADGQASYAVPGSLAAGTYEVTAAADLEGCFSPSNAVAVLTVVAPDEVLPDEAEDVDEVAGVSTVARPPSGILPATGLDTGVQLAAIAGSVLLAAGAVVLLLRRRRSPVTVLPPPDAGDRSSAAP